MADKYGGDFTVSCDEDKFHALVMLQTLWSFRAIYSHLVQSWFEMWVHLTTILYETIYFVGKEKFYQGGMRYADNKG
ncbi:hypothetical protein D7X25_21585 [bacterium 1XD42-8]|nr:hypothetical protein D7X25_21585 [bacterium 1XD42-8]